MILNKRLKEGNKNRIMKLYLNSIKIILPSEWWLNNNRVDILLRAVHLSRPFAIPPGCQAYTPSADFKFQS